MHNILITGGCGFIGSNAIRHFYHAYPQYRIINLDLLTYAGNPDNLLDIEALEAGRPAAERRYFFIRGDICDERLLDILFGERRFEIVINFAAETHVDRSIVNMSDFIRTNIGGTRALIEAVRKYGVKRFVHISTDEIYGDVAEGRCDEESPLRPSNPYSSSKAAADLIVQSFIRTHKVPAVIVRGSNNYGSHQYPEKLIPLAISNLIEGKKIPVHGDGMQVRSWLHVKDFSRAIDRVAHNAPDGEIYNVSGEERTNLDILEMLARHLGKDLMEHKEHINDRPGSDIRYAPSCEKLQRTLGWERQHRLDMHLDEIVDWYLANRPWWDAIKQKREFQNHYERQATGRWY